MTLGAYRRNPPDTLRPGSDTRRIVDADATLAATPGLLPLGLGTLTGIVFSPALRNGFVWDDIPNLVANPHYRELGWDQLRWIATSIHLGHYIPLTRLSFAVDYVLWGMNPAGYHLSNIVLHSIGVVLFYYVAAHLARKTTRLTGVPLSIAAMTAALFFAIHPLRAESVAWVTEGAMSSPASSSSWRPCCTSARATSSALGVGGFSRLRS